MGETAAAAGDVERRVRFGTCCAHHTLESGRDPQGKMADRTWGEEGGLTGWTGTGLCVSALAKTSIKTRIGIIRLIA